MNELHEIETEIIDPHAFHIYDWDDGEDWIDSLIQKFAPYIVEYYTAYSELRNELNSLLEDDIGFTSENILSCLNDCVVASIPDPDRTSQPEHLKAYRSDFPEILASLCLQELFDTIIPVDGIKLKEVSDSPHRGIDVLGYEVKDDLIHLIICEVKGSSSFKTPPECVSGKNDSIENQLLHCITNRQRTLSRLNAIFAKSDAEHKKMLAKMMIYWQQEMHDKLKVVLCPFLVREKSKYYPSDYDFMKTKLDQYDPGVIRFIVVCINEDLSKISRQLYEFAPHLEVYNDD